MTLSRKGATDMHNEIGLYFDRYQWMYEQLEDNVWRATFAAGQDEDFDLYVMAGDEWIHFAVSPFLSRPVKECLPHLYETTLRLNQQMRLVHFALDEDGDLNILADAPRAGFGYDQFAKALDALRGYTDSLIIELQRVATRMDYRSPLVQTIG